MIWQKKVFAKNIKIAVIIREIKYLILSNDNMKLTDKEKEIEDWIYKLLCLKWGLKPWKNIRKIYILMKPFIVYS